MGRSLPRCALRLARAALVAAAVCPTPSQAHNQLTAQAVPLTGITVDGRLDDWPPRMAAYPIASVSGLYRPAPPDGPQDLGAVFHVGHSREQSLLYVAVVVRDDDSVVRPEMPTFYNQDVCEIYVDGSHASGGSGPVLQYCMVPGPSRVAADADGNPRLLNGSTPASGVRAACLRLGVYTVYEWAIPLFASVPDRPVKAEPGTTIGFDAVVSDADGEEQGNWVAWTPGTGKVGTPGLLGDLVFLAEGHGPDAPRATVVPAGLAYGAVGTLAGAVTQAADGTPFPGAQVEIWRAERQVGGTTAGQDGGYSQALLAGEYSVRVSARGVRGGEVRRPVTVTRGGVTRCDLTLQDLGTCFHVDDDAPEGGSGSPEDPFATVGEALAATSEGDTVRVGPGWYREFVVMPSGVTLLGAGPDSTFLDGEGKRSLVRITASHVALEGFALVRGRGQATLTPGAEIGENWIAFAGILLDGRDVRITGNLIAGNVSQEWAGALACFMADSSVVITNNLFAGNTGIGAGGLALVRGSARAHHNTVVSNAARDGGGGIHCTGGQPRLEHNAVVGNDGGGIAYQPWAFGTAMDSASAGPVLSGNEVWGNAGYDYSGVEPGAGDRWESPRFVDPAAGDYRIAAGAATGDMGADPAFLARAAAGLKKAGLLPALRLPAAASVQATGAPVVQRMERRSVRFPAARPLRVDTLAVGIQPLRQAAEHQVVTYDRASGMSPGSIRAVAPASDGSVWFGTERGAARYDGLWSILDSTSGLPHSDVRAVVAARDGSVWLACLSSVVRYQEGAIRVAGQSGFDVLLEDPRGGIWGAPWYDTVHHVDSTWTYLDLADTSGTRSMAFPVWVEGPDALWSLAFNPFVGQSRSLALRHGPEQTEAWEMPPLVDPGPSSFLAPEWIRTCRAARGGFWIGWGVLTFGDSYGANVRSAVAERWTLARLDADRGRLEVYRLPRDWVARYEIWEDPPGVLWAVGPERVLQFDGTTWRGTRGSGLGGDTAAPDGQGGYWAADARGARHYGPATWTTYRGPERLEGTRVRCAVQDSAGALWFGGEGGLARRGPDGAWTQLAAGDTVADLAVDRHGTVWAATQRGLRAWDGHGRELPVGRAGLAAGPPTALAVGADGRLWAGTPAGLYRADGPRWTRVPVGTWVGPEGRDPNAITGLAADAQGRLWIATRAGLFAWTGGQVQGFLALFHPERRVDLDSLFALAGEEQLERGLREVLHDEEAMAWFQVRARPDLSGATDPAWRRVREAYGRLVRQDRGFLTLVRRAVENGHVVRSLGQTDAAPPWLAMGWLGGQPDPPLPSVDARGVLRFALPQGVLEREGEEWRFVGGSELPAQGAVHAVRSDAAGRLWLATETGAACRIDDEWVTLGARDGLADDRVLDLLQARDGFLWFATAGGITRYQPDHRPPQTRVARGPAGIVGHGTSGIDFEFEGGDREWAASGTGFSWALVRGPGTPGAGDWSPWSESRYLQIPPPADGAYALHVRARDRMLNVDPTPAVHRFRVEPPFWKRTWFLAGSGLGMLALVVSTGQAGRSRRRARRAERALTHQLEQQLRTAHEMQMGLMPTRPPAIPGLDLAGRCLPASHVGGDFFQYWRQGGDLSIALADVTGHAMEAAIPAVLFSGLLENQMEAGVALDEVFTRANRSLHRIFSGRHILVCFTMGQLEAGTGVFRWSNGGCPALHHFCAATGRIAELEVVAYPLGARPDTVYPVHCIQLASGDRVVFCSDGVVEAESTAGEVFGYERTAAALREGCVAGLSAGALVEHLVGAVQQFTAGRSQEDDITCVVLHVVWPLASRLIPACVVAMRSACAAAWATPPRASARPTGRVAWDPPPAGRRPQAAPSRQREEYDPAARAGRRLSVLPDIHQWQAVPPPRPRRPDPHHRGALHGRPAALPLQLCHALHGRLAAAHGLQGLLWRGHGPRADHRALVRRGCPSFRSLAAARVTGLQVQARKASSTVRLLSWGEVFAPPARRHPSPRQPSMPSSRPAAPAPDTWAPGTACVWAAASTAVRRQPPFAGGPATPGLHAAPPAAICRAAHGDRHHPPSVCPIRRRFHRRLVRSNLRTIVNWSLRQSASLSTLSPWSVGTRGCCPAISPKTGRWPWSPVRDRSARRPVRAPAPESIAT
ncbi:MAG: SpoIIE family protein phosphatase [Candidatus Latescibacterota bacterium]